MKKFLLILIVLCLLTAGIVVWNKKEQMDNDDAPIVAKPTSSTPAPSSAAAQYKDGSYTSDVVQTDRGFGPLQIKLVVSGGKISDVQFLQFPNKPGHTTEVSNAALPLLKQETITAQSAQVDIVTGATQTSEAFQQVLSATLAMAK
jgi:uncharacterized protein with FMN-binding domain